MLPRLCGCQPSLIGRTRQTGKLLLGRDTARTLRTCLQKLASLDVTFRFAQKEGDRRNSLCLFSSFT